MFNFLKKKNKNIENNSIDAIKIAALLIIWAFSSPYWAWPYLLLLGLNVGMLYTGITALWAELYGPLYLGSIRSFVVAVTVLASALGPPSMGILIDIGISTKIISNSREHLFKYVFPEYPKPTPLLKNNNN